MDHAAREAALALQSAEVDRLQYLYEAAEDAKDLIPAEVDARYDAWYAAMMLWERDHEVHVWATACERNND